MSPVSLDCPFLIAPSLFSILYLYKITTRMAPFLCDTGVNNIDIITNIVNDLSINGVIYDCLFF